MNSNKGEKFPIEVLSGEEVRALMAATSPRGVCGVRDRALISVLYRCGLRIAEACALMPKDVDLGGRTIAVLCGKGGKRRTVGFDEETAAAIERWVAVRAARGINGVSPLFCTLAAAPMKRTQFTRRLKELARIAGIEKRVHPHGLRHSFAAKMAEEGVPLPIIQLALGHTRLVTTERYVSHMRPQAVIAAMQELRW